MTGYAQNEAIEVHLDYACELYQFKTGAKAHIALARSLDTGVSGSADGGREAKREMWRGGEQGLAEDYDYVMYGKVSCCSGFVGSCGRVKVGNPAERAFRSMFGLCQR